MRFRHGRHCLKRRRRVVHLCRLHKILKFFRTNLGLPNLAQKTYFVLPAQTAKSVDFIRDEMNRRIHDAE